MTSDTSKNPTSNTSPTLRTLLALAALLLALGAGFSVMAADDADEFAKPPADAEVRPSGLVTKLLREGTGERKPDDHDLVSVHFIARTPDGKIFRNTYTTERPLVFNLQKVFPGWSEGLQQMVVGEKRRMWIPAHLAPQNPSSGPAGAVVFDAELLGILDLPTPPSEIDPPPADTKRTATGAFTKMIRPGTGDSKPTLEDSALLHFTVWDKDGQLFDTSIERRRPTMFPLDKVLYPFAECVQEMVVGEVRRCWIPGQLVNGQWPGAPSGSLVFELQLLEFAKTADILNDAGVDLPPTRNSGGAE